jgi:DNA-binding NarL/FixJ family response regulator
MTLIRNLQSGYNVMRGFRKNPRDAQEAARNGRSFAPLRIFWKGLAKEMAAQDHRGQDCPTPREQEVLELLKHGYSNRQIAAEIGVSVRTVRFHLENLMSKLEADNRVQVLASAVRRGWIEV